MGQVYLQRFVYRDGVSKSAIDEAWAEAFKTFARSGNWGGVDKGVTHRQTYGTGWGGYVLIEVEDPEAFGRYQAPTTTRRTGMRSMSRGNPFSIWIGHPRRPSAA